MTISGNEAGVQDAHRVLDERGVDDDPWAGIPAELLGGIWYDADTAGGCG